MSIAVLLARIAKALVSGDRSVTLLLALVQCDLSWSSTGSGTLHRLRLRWAALCEE